MKKLIQGIVEFRKNVQQGYREAFGRLALGQAPNALFIACSDSRVIPNTFASTNPGDLFVVRNVGNFIPLCGNDGLSTSDESEAAAGEFSLNHLPVTDIIICGHSECGAMQALMQGRETVKSPHLKEWLRHGEDSLEKWSKGFVLDPALPKHNQLSQINVLCQMQHVQSYDLVKKRVADHKLRVHGWWFDVANADVYAFNPAKNKFVLIDETESARMLAELEPPVHE